MEQDTEAVLRSQGYPSSPTIEILEQTSTLQEDLYRRRPLEGDPLPIVAQPVSIADRLPEGEEIAAVLRKIRTAQAGVPSGMKAEHLKTWRREATIEKYMDTEKWYNLVNIMQVAFWDGCILEAITRMTIVLIPKVGGGYIGIGMVEVVWKVCT